MKSLFLLGALISTALTAHEHHDHPTKTTPLVQGQQIYVGSGANQYKNIPNWGEVPKGSETIGWTHGGVIIDQAGLIYVSTNGDNTVIVYNAEGKIQRQFGKQWKGIHSMLLKEEAGEEFIYAARLWGQEIVKFRLDGSLVWRLTGPPVQIDLYKNEAVKFKVTAVAVASNGDIFLADGYGTDLIHQYDKDRQYIRTFGGKGKESKHLNNAHGLLIDSSGDQELLIICDRGNRKIKRFNLDGTYLDTVNEGLQLPGSIVRWKNLYAVAELKGGIALLDQGFKFLVRLGENPNAQLRAKFDIAPELWENGIFTAPHSCAFDSAGNLYIADWNKSGRIHKFIRKAGYL